MNYALDFLLIFLPLFVAIDPAGCLPIFLAMTDRYTPEQRRRIARRATFVAGVTGILFVVTGQALFRFLGVSFADFQIAGGLLLVILAIVDLLSAGKPAVDEKKAVELDSSVGVVPLAVPLIVGPATMTTSLLLVNSYGEKYTTMFGAPQGQIVVVTMVCAALALNLAIMFAAMWYSDWLVRIVGKNTMAVVNKIVMILLAAIAVSLIRKGIESIVIGLKM